MSQVPMSPQWLEITDKWYDREHAEFGEPVLPELIGAKIIAMGAVEGWSNPDYGALAIEYLSEGSNSAKRLVVAFHAGRMWCLPNQLWESNEA